LKHPAVRLAALLLVVAAAFAATTGAASALTPCGQQVIDDWYGSKTGQLSKVYPLHCYRDALNIVSHETDLEVYSNARSDIQRAMALAIALGKNNGKGNGPGGTTQYSTVLPSFHGGPDAANGGGAPTGTDPYPPKTDAGPISTVLHGSSPSSVPVPAIVLGAIAALLLALGSAAYVARRRQQRRQTLRPRHANGQNP
jgi:hypothetical protein